MVLDEASQPAETMCGSPGIFIFNRSGLLFFGTRFLTCSLGFFKHFTREATTGELSICIEADSLLLERVQYCWVPEAGTRAVC